MGIPFVLKHASPTVKIPGAVADGLEEGFDGDDVFVGQGQTIETIGTMTELQVTAKAIASKAARVWATAWTSVLCIIT